MTEKQKDYIPATSDIIANRIKTMEDRPPLPATTSAHEIMLAAVRNGLGKEQLEVLERMFDLDIKAKERQAKEAHFAAMAEFNRTMPPIIKDKLNSQFKSKYSSVENILDSCRPYLAEQGLYVSFGNPAQTEGSMSLSIIVSHSLGHRETISMTMPIVSPPVGKVSGQSAMNPTQAIKATFTYLRGALLEAALGIAGSDATHDNNGNSGAPEEFINDQCFADLRSLISEVKAREVDFCKFLKIESLEKMPASMYEKAVKELQRKIK